MAAPTPEQRQQVARWALQTIEHLGAADLLEVLRIEWSSRMRSALGRALYERPHRFDGTRAERPKTCTVKFNARAWGRLDEQQRYETVVHEVCHLVAEHRTSRRRAGHGPEWQSLMWDCGLRPDRCHTVDVSDLRARRRRFVARCACSEHTIGAKRARNLKAGARYQCRRCRGTLSLAEGVAATA